MGEEIKIVFDRVGKTLDVWFGKPREVICEELEEGFLIKKDKETGEVVGFEKFNVKSEEIPEVRVLVKEEPMVV